MTALVIGALVVFGIPALNFMTDLPGYLWEVWKARKCS